MIGSRSLRRISALYCNLRFKRKAIGAYRKYVRAGNDLMPYCLAKRLSLILTKSTPNESVSSSICSNPANTLSQVTQLRASKTEIQTSKWKGAIRCYRSYIFIFGSYRTQSDIDISKLSKKTLRRSRGTAVINLIGSTLCFTFREGDTVFFWWQVYRLIIVRQQHTVFLANSPSFNSDGRSKIASITCMFEIDLLRELLNS